MVLANHGRGLQRLSEPAAAGHRRARVVRHILMGRFLRAKHGGGDGKGPEQNGIILHTHTEQTPPRLYQPCAATPRSGAGEPQGTMSQNDSSFQRPHGGRARTCGAIACQFTRLAELCRAVSYEVEAPAIVGSTPQGQASERATAAERPSLLTPTCQRLGSPGEQTGKGQAAS